MEIEGECKVKKYHFLKINYPKAIFLTFLLIISFFGLFVLKYSIKARSKIFYSQAKKQ